MRSVPESGVIELREYGYRDWKPELVRYKLPEKWQKTKFVLKDATGKAIPFQVSEGVLMFVTSLPKGKAVTYKLQPGTGVSPAATL